MSTKPKENVLNGALSPKENLYQLLSVSPTATISEIIQAYRSARQAFSEGSLATYSLMAEKEKKEILDNLEYAYLTLTNPEKRRIYDKQFSDERAGKETASSNQEFSTPDEQRLDETKETPVLHAVPPPIAVPTLQGKVTGHELRRVREQLSYTVEDVARITKIPKRYLIAIEAEDVQKMPAHVYLQGFLKNLSNLYKLNARNVVDGYLERVRIIKS